MKAEGKDSEYKEHLELIRKTFSDGKLPLDLKDEKGRTAFHYLAEFMDKDSFDKFEGSLDGRKIPYAVADQEGNTPLHVAILSKNISAVNTLADGWVSVPQGVMTYYHPELFAKNNAGKNPLDLMKKLKVEKKDKELKKEIITYLQEETERYKQLEKQGYRP